MATNDLCLHIQCFAIDQRRVDEFPRGGFGFLRVGDWTCLNIWGKFLSHISFGVVTRCLTISSVNYGLVGDYDVQEVLLR